MPPIDNPQEVLQGVADRAQELKAQKDRTTVSAARLADPVNRITVPEPKVATQTPVNSNMIQGVSDGITFTLDEFRANQQKRSDLMEQQAALAGQGSIGDFLQEQREEFEIPDNLKTLKDIQLQLADMDEGSDLTKTRIQGAGGQTLSQSQREVTQEDRENAVRRSGLAARAAVLEGNIETSTALVNQAVQTMYQDRTLQNQNLIAQINSIQSVLGEQTPQLLEQDRRKYEEDQAAVQRVQGAVDAAMQSGAATEADIRTLTDPSISDEQRLAAAQGIVSRGASEMRNLDVASKQASIAASRASVSLAERKFQYQKQQDTLAAELEAMMSAGEVSEQEAEDIQKVEQALTLQDLTTQLRNHPGFDQSVGSIGSRIIGLEGGIAGQAFNALSGQGAGFDALYDQLTNNLTLGNLDKMSGVLSETDIQILSGAASRLKKTTTEKEFLGVLDEMDRVFERTVQDRGITPSQAEFYYGADSDALSEVDFIYDNAFTTNAIGNTTSF